MQIMDVIMLSRSYIAYSFVHTSEAELKPPLQNLALIDG